MTAGIAVLASLTGCAMPKVTSASSPLAQEAARVAAEPGEYPNVADIPKPPTDVRGAGEWRAAVQDSEAAGRRVAAQTAPETFTLKETETYAASGRRAATPPPAVTTPADTAAFVRAARERATPPPTPR
ncbi:hypothetical protein P7B02_10410 [Caulobacter segnis]|uniref:hypothetical protein n=1 Tax=Caulobacter segnis TaxID=88688 RepID=UPI00240EF0AD|nr:hypothetical protein [Caulobacter segnis]MDG2521955.1 hypothetical protein [Caulobacter segnis]